MGHLLDVVASGNRAWRPPIRPRYAQDRRPRCEPQTIRTTATGPDADPFFGHIIQGGAGAAISVSAIGIPGVGDPHAYWEYGPFALADG